MADPPICYTKTDARADRKDCRVFYTDDLPKTKRGWTNKEMSAYAIISVDDTRKDLREASARELQKAGLTPLTIHDDTFVDGRVPGAIEDEIRKNHWRVTGNNFHNGELGIWFSQMNTLYDSLYEYNEFTLILEDDAVVQPIFQSIFPVVLGELPIDMDFFAWAIPADQKVDYYYNRVFDENGNWHIASHVRHRYSASPHYIGSELVCKAYQGYQAVAVMYSKYGVQKIINLVNENGIDTPYDLFLFREHYKGNLNGYTLLPDVYPVITYEERGTIARASGMYN